MLRMTTRPVAVVLTVALMVWAGGSLPTQAAPKLPGLQELEEIRDDISLLNLLRGLYLSRNQVEQLCLLAEKAHQQRETVKALYVRDQAAILKTFKGLREALLLAPGREKEAQGSAHDLSQRMEEVVGRTIDQLNRLEKEVTTILSTSQQSIVSDFKPCLIPPQDLKNPVRVGQAGASQGLLGKVADLIYATPADIWQARGTGVLDKVAVHLEQETGEMKASMRQDIRRRLSEAAEKIRTASPIDYPLRKAELAAELQLIDYDKKMRNGRYPLGKIGKWFLSESAHRVLPAWKQALENGLDLVDADDINMGEEDIGKTLAEAGAHTVNLLNRYYHKNKNRELPLKQGLIAPIEEAVAANNPDRFAAAVLQGIIRLGENGADQPLNRALAQFIRRSAHILELPLLHPKFDPFGFVEEFRRAEQESLEQARFNRLVPLAQTIIRFKRP